MASRERIILKEDEKGDEDEEEAEHRRSRLWLGYSEDNLLNTRNSQRYQAHCESQEDSRAPSPNNTISPQRSPSNGPHAVPDDYSNLNEVAAPSPIETQKERRHGWLEDPGVHAMSRKGDAMPDDYENLDEVVAPPPIDDAQQERRQGYLEDRTGKRSWTGVRNPVHQPSSKSPSMDEERMQKEPTPQRKDSALAIEIYTISYLIFFSILGTLARLGLQALTFYPGAPVQTGLLWANVGGSLIMGFLSEDQKLFRDTKSTSPVHEVRDEQKGRPHRRSRAVDEKLVAFKKSLPLYIGLATGFCGSFTSFSSFIRDAFFALSNALPVPVQHLSNTPTAPTVNVSRNPGYSFLAALAVLIITAGLSLIALQFGAHIALFIQPYTPSISFLLGRKLVHLSFVFLAWGCWLAAILLAIWPPDRPGGSVGNTTWMQETWRSQALFALVFAPLGCLLRFYSSIHLNGRIKAFPLGTFAVNIFGTAMAAMFTDLQRVPIGGLVGCQVLQGMSDGFCGCLTTVSTWVAELTALRLRHAYIYGTVSLGTALSLFIIITGSLQWTRGFTHPLCTT